MNKLDYQYLKQKLGDNINNLLIYDSVRSTNDLAKTSLNKQHKMLILTQHQSKGRGTQERRFYSEKNKGIYASFIVDTKFIDHHPSFLAIIAACAIVELCSLYNIDAKLKWVNDVFINDQKCAGILCETTNDESLMVIGIGINVFKQNFPQDLLNIATTLEQHSIKALNLNDIVVQLFTLLVKLMNQDASTIIELYHKYYKDKGKSLDYVINDSLRSAIIIGIDNHGRLKISDDSLLYSTNQIIRIY